MLFEQQEAATWKKDTNKEGRTRLKTPENLGFKLGSMHLHLPVSREEMDCPEGESVLTLGVVLTLIFFLSQFQVYY